MPRPPLTTPAGGGRAIVKDEDSCDAWLDDMRECRLSVRQDRQGEAWLNACRPIVSGTMAGLIGVSFPAFRARSILCVLCAFARVKSLVFEQLGEPVALPVARGSRTTSQPRQFVFERLDSVQKIQDERHGRPADFQLPVQAQQAVNAGQCLR